ncbi:MAG TPA: lasso peptide biosynthesis B2 protein [Bryobacteraceae bacterium]|jgi:hypothetical protein|nr:lasso peptide biosynthesis B2 protein [Bryobacteraceae bacterium]
MIVEAIASPLLLPLGFRFIGVQKTQARLRKWAERYSRKHTRTDADAAISSALRAQRVVKRMTGLEGSCLVRSLSLWAMLLRRGVHTDLRIGMRRSSGKMEGHAWLEVEGNPVNEKPAIVGAYTVFEEPLSFDQMTRTW